jgi:hypothetical protein
VDTKKNRWGCRICDVKNEDVIELTRRLDKCGFEAACEKITGEPPPRRDRKANGHAPTPRKVVVATYDYFGPDGTLLHQTRRLQFRLPDGSFVLGKKGKKPKKTFLQRRPDGKRSGQFIDKMDGVEVVPYRLSELMRAVAAEQPIFIFEGEGKVDLARDMGLAATCAPMGAGKWPEHFVTYFAGADAVIVPMLPSSARIGFVLPKMGRSFFLCPVPLHRPA